jgi:DNA invertase Pin-like site-specific DNA recombinase
MTIIGYARVSSREQAENSSALDQQIARLRNAGAEEIIAEVHSAYKGTRPLYEDLLKRVERKEVTEVIITRIDRITRQLKDIDIIINTFEKSGVKLRALDDNINTGTSSGRFILNIIGNLAQMECDRNSEKVKYGWQHLRDKSTAVNPPFGYMVENERFVLDTKLFISLLDADAKELKRDVSRSDIAKHLISIFFTAKTLRGTLRLFHEIYGSRAIIRDPDNTSGKGKFKVNELSWSTTGFSTWITNPVLAGHTAYKKNSGHGTQRLPESQWDIRYNTHPDHTLLTISQQQEIKDTIEENRQHRGFGTSQVRHPAAGLVRCALCNSVMYSQRGSRGKTPGFNYYFQCNKYTVHACSNKKMIRVEQVNDAAIKALHERYVFYTTNYQLPQLTYESDPEYTRLLSTLEGLESLPHSSIIADAIFRIKASIEAIINKYSGGEELYNKRHAILRQLFMYNRFDYLAIPDEQIRDIFHQTIKHIWVEEGLIIKIDLKV